jgi:hypothetical protein
MAIATVLFIGCGSLNMPTERAEYDFYNDNYNYIQIHMIYMNSPRWFYDNYYLDMYGRQYIYRYHPYYKRYLRERARRIRNNNQVVLPTVGHTRVNHTRNVKRNNASTHTRRTTTVPTRTRVTTKSTPTRTITRTNTPTKTKITPRARTITRTVRPTTRMTQRAPTRTIQRSAPVQRTSSSKRRN